MTRCAPLDSNSVSISVNSSLRSVQWEGRFFLSWLASREGMASVDSITWRLPINVGTFRPLAIKKALQVCNMPRLRKLALEALQLTERPIYTMDFEDRKDGQIAQQECEQEHLQGCGKEELLRASMVGRMTELQEYLSDRGVEVRWTMLR